MTQPPEPPSTTGDTPISPAPPPPPLPPVTLLAPAEHSKHRSRPLKVLRAFRSAFRSFPILTPPTCRLPSTLNRFPGASSHHHDGHISGAARTTGTLYGRRKARITLAIQDKPRSVPILLIDLNVPTAKFMQEMGSAGLVRVALECEKKAADKTRLLDEPLWTSFVNGRSIGYAARREAGEADLSVMQLLHAVSMGAGVLPTADAAADAADGELTYMRAHFDRVVGSKDSETFYMLNPEGNSGPELSIFFVRI